MSHGEAIVIEYDDEDLDDELDWTHTLIEGIAIPALVVGFTALCVLGASLLIWAIVWVWQQILGG